MSLKLYAPDDLDIAETEFPNLSVYHEPEPEFEDDCEVLSWRFIRRGNQSSFIEAVQRSRLLHRHLRDPSAASPDGHGRVSSALC